MKILHANNYLHGGGTESYIHRIMAGLSKRGHTNELYVQSSTAGDHPLKAFRNTYASSTRLNHHIQRFQPDIIHVHNIVNYHLLKKILEFGKTIKSIHEFRPFCKVTRINPITVSPCDGHLSMTCFKTGCFQYRLKSLYRFWADRQAMKLIPQFPRIWVMSRYMADFIAPLIRDPSKLNIVPLFYDAPEKKPPTPEQNPRIFSAGRLTQGKGFEFLIEALSYVEQPFVMKIAGDGPLRNQLEKMVSQRNLPVEFLGRLTVEEITEWYAWCRFFVFPSDYPEPFGIVGLEAMGFCSTRYCVRCWRCFRLVDPRGNRLSCAAPKYS